MHQFRVTKYDPSFRNDKGYYLRDEWTSFLDVGKSYRGVVLTLTEYERVETAYVGAALGFLCDAGVYTLAARGVENPYHSPSAPTEGAQLETEALEAALRSVLREEFWCRFECDSAFVHFGWDYYMYVGVSVPCEAAKATAQASGLFVEPFESPYHPRIESEEDVS